jgi:DNA-binding response OmpR family regulator
MRILYVEDDVQLGQATSSGLKDEFAVDWFTNVDDAEEALRQVAYDMIVLDINLPGRSGLEFLREQRAKGNTLPVLLLTARDTVPQRVQGLNAGADDYLIKPYDFEELLARIGALVRRRSQPYRDVMRYRDLVVDFSGHTVHLDGTPLAVTQREFDVLRILLEEQGRCLSKDQIAEKMYGWDDEVESNTIEVYVSALRRKLGKEYIRTVRGLGYLMEKHA